MRHSRPATASLALRCLVAVCATGLALGQAACSGSSEPEILGNGGATANGGYTAGPIKGSGGSGSGLSGGQASGGATGTANVGGAGGTTKTSAAAGGNSTGGSVVGGANTGGARTGGASATGGPMSPGGSSATGGARTGGASSGGTTGGAKATGGTTGSGGASSGGSTGGTKTTGGTAGTGGTTSTGGTTTTTPAEGDQWVSPTGDDANPGTETKPLKNLQTAVGRAQPGTTIWMMAGTHAYSARIGIKSTKVTLGLGGNTETAPAVPNAKDGLAGNPTKIVGVPGSRPVIDFLPQKDKVDALGKAECSSGPNGSATAMTTHRNNARGISIYAEYWQLKNLEIKNAADNCIYIAGSYNTVEDVVIHDCGDTGLQITGSEGDTSYAPSYNKIINCDSYLNIDDFVCEVNPGEDADGFAAKLAIGPGNEFRGCRSWQNSDDGWDLFAAPAAVTIENCWAFDMPNHPRKTNASDGNGFKLGGVRSDDNICSETLGNNKAPHKLSMCFGFYNLKWGFDLNNNSSKYVTCDKCGGWGNGKNKTPFEEYDPNSGHTCLSSGIVHTNDITGPSLTPDQARAAKRAANGDLPDITTL